MSRKPKSTSSRSSRRARPRTGSKSKASRRRSVGLAEIKDDLSRYLRLAESEEILITRHGKPAGVLIGFASEDEWLDYRLENHPEFLDRVARARADLAAGKGTRLEDL
jgi:prevent-host-death family protein